MGELLCKLWSGWAGENLSIPDRAFIDAPGWANRDSDYDWYRCTNRVGYTMRRCQPLPEEDEAECLTPTGTSATPFSQAMEDSSTPSNGSAPDLVNHPHLDNTMRSLSSSVASRRKEYMQKRTEAESQQHQQDSSLSRAERIAFMKRTRSVSAAFAVHSHARCKQDSRVDKLTMSEQVPNRLLPQQASNAAKLSSGMSSFCRASMCLYLVLYFRTCSMCILAHVHGVRLGVDTPQQLSVLGAALEAQNGKNATGARVDGPLDVLACFSPLWDRIYQKLSPPKKGQAPRLTGMAANDISIDPLLTQRAES